jgi:hypothetical protein
MKATFTAALPALMLFAAPANATDFSFSGQFNQDDDIAFFDFVASGDSTVTLRSYSYAGGTNVAGAVFGAGGFDPILTLYNLTTGARVTFQDDADSGVPADPVTGQRFDVNFAEVLSAGSYRVALSQFDNFGGETLFDPFRQGDAGNFTAGSCASGAEAPFCDVAGGGVQRTGNWAFDILGVDTAVGPGAPAVPEPSTWTLMLAGFGITGYALRRRRAVVAIA